MSTTPQIKPKKYRLEVRDRTMVATPGSQRRVYDGCPHPKDWEFVWGPWKQLCSIGPEDMVDSLETYVAGSLETCIADSLKMCRSINETAVRARGEVARSQFRAVDVETGECYEL